MSHPEVVITLVIFKISNEKLVFLSEQKQLIKRAITQEKDLDDIAKDIFHNVTKIPLHKNYTEQLYTFSQKNKREIAVVYYVLLPDTNISLTENLSWIPVENVGKRDPNFPIISYAVQRLRWKIEYTNVVYSLLPETFTLSELQKLYETILNQPLDKRNFRKKILSLGFLKATNQKKIGNARPALLYRFKKREPQIIQIFS